MSKHSDFQKAAIANFIEYLQCKTVQPNPDYDSAVKFLTRQANELSLPIKVVEIIKVNPIVIITWEGTDPSLPSVVLNSHIDVVPVFPEHWICDPFEGKRMDDGKIYARGSQDMKCVGIQYLEAVRKLKSEGKRFKRTIHMTFVPDEELGGYKGMAVFVEHEEFKKLNVGFAMDEGLASPTDIYSVYYGERGPWWFVATCTGNPGHGSKFIENTAAEKIQKLINKVLAFREEQRMKLEENPSLTLGDVTTVNMTFLEGGVQLNVVPAELTVGFDMRVPPTVNLVELEKQIQRWCDESGEGIKLEYRQKEQNQKVTTPDNSNPWWATFRGVLEKLKLQYRTELFPAATDSRYLRKHDIPAFGFSPMINTPILLHDHNEYLHEDVFLRGIEIYEEIIPALANHV